MATTPSSTLTPIPILSKRWLPAPRHLVSTFPGPIRPSRFKCLASQSGFFTKLGRLVKEKAKSDVDKLFCGFSKTCNNLSVIDELLVYWNLSDTDRVLDELEEALLVSDFGPKITIKIVEDLREDILAGKLKSGSEIKAIGFIDTWAVLKFGYWSNYTGLSTTSPKIMYTKHLNASSTS